MVLIKGDSLDNINQRWRELQDSAIKNREEWKKIKKAKAQKEPA